MGTTRLKNFALYRLLFYCAFIKLSGSWHFYRWIYFHLQCYKLRKMELINFRIKLNFFMTFEIFSVSSLINAHELMVSCFVLMRHTYMFIGSSFLLSCFSSNGENLKASITLSSWDFRFNFFLLLWAWSLEIQSHCWSDHSSSDSVGALKLVYASEINRK